VRCGELGQDLEKVRDIGRAGRLAGEIDIRGLVENFVADLNANARLAGNPDAVILDTFALEHAAEDILIVGAQETCDRDRLAEVGQERGYINPLSSSIHL
jgi:hypothetical protein